MDYELKQKVNELFKALRKAGYFARQNLGDCQTCGGALIPEDRTGKYVFYHSQDRDNAIESNKLMLAWGGDGKEIVALAHKVGLQTEWNGTGEQRIQVSL